MATIPQFHPFPAALYDSRPFTPPVCGGAPAPPLHAFASPLSRRPASRHRPFAAVQRGTKTSRCLASAAVHPTSMRPQLPCGPAHWATCHPTLRSFAPIKGTSIGEQSTISSTAAKVGKNDVLIVGPGVLGRIVADKWKQMHPDCQTFGQTLTTNHHAELVELGIIPLTSDSQMEKFPFVVFCAPPYGNPDYPGAIRSAASRWNGEGSFVFTSSSAVYDCSDNGICDEDYMIVPIGRSPRTDVLLKAEKEVVDAGGCVVRLAGLYKLDRGAHAYWLEKGLVESRPDHVLNLIHYEDAASLCISVLKHQFRSRIFLGCDDYPISRQEIMDCVSKSGKYSKKFQGFTGTSDSLGKRLNNLKTRAELGWQPKYPSFPQFLGLQQ